MEIKIFEFNPLAENTYIVYDETNECVIIDAGNLFPEENNAIQNFIQNKELTVKHLLNTHLHFDHILGNIYIEEQFGLKTKAHKGDKFLMDGMPAQMKLFGFEVPKKTPEIGTYLEENDTIGFGNQKLIVFHIPGHSPGSVVFYNPVANCVFVGDVLFHGSIGRTDLAGGDYKLLIEGIRNKLLTLPPETIVYPGHGPSTTIGEEKRNNFYLS